MAVISMAKLLLLLAGMAILLLSNQRPAPAMARKLGHVAILLVLGVMALSTLWTTAPPGEAFSSLAKYGKLLIIPVLMLLIRDRREALYALFAFVAAQVFLVLSSWALFAQLPVPWATSRMALKEYAVFSSYLDQGIMSAVTAAVCWHLRHLMPGRYGAHAAIGVAIIAMADVLFVLSGRSGHVVAIALLSLAIMWMLPKKLWPVVVLLPFALAAALFFSSSKVHERLTLVSSEVRSYGSEQPAVTSSALRLMLWSSALELMAERPLLGSGVGSWSTEFNRLQRQKNAAHVDVGANGNPHQEYLQWGVQLGLPGLLLFIGLLVCLLRDAFTPDKAVFRAAASTLVALGVACLFNSSVYDALIGDFFCIALGVLLALAAHPAQPASINAEVGGRTDARPLSGADA